MFLEIVVNTIRLSFKYFSSYYMYQVQSLLEDHGLFIKSGHSILARKLIPIIFKPFRITFIFLSSLCEDIVFYDFFWVKISTLLRRSRTVGRLWSSNTFWQVELLAYHIIDMTLSFHQKKIYPKSVQKWAQNLSLKVARWKY